MLGEPSIFRSIPVFRLVQDGRDRLFLDYLDAGGNPDEILSRFTKRVEESVKSKLKWGFKPKSFLTERYGEAKGERIATKKKDMGLNLGLLVFLPQH